MNFSWALMQLCRKRRVSNINWNGKNMYLEMQVPDEHSKMQLPYIYMCNTNGKLVPWTPSQMDLLSDGWIVIDQENIEVTISYTPLYSGNPFKTTFTCKDPKIDDGVDYNIKFMNRLMNAVEDGAITTEDVVWTVATQFIKLGEPYPGSSEEAEERALTRDVTVAYYKNQIKSSIIAGSNNTFVCNDTVNAVLQYVDDLVIFLETS